MENSETIIALLVVILMLLIMLFIGCIFFVFIPMGQIKQQVNKATGDIAQGTALIRNYQNNINQITQVATNVQQLVDKVDKIAPQVETAVCSFLPHLPFCPSG